MPRRSVFTELMAGVEDMQADREGRRKLKRTTAPKRIVLGEGVLESPFPDLPKTLGMWNGPQRVLLPIPDEAQGKRVRLVLEVIE